MTVDHLPHRIGQHRDRLDSLRDPLYSPCVQAQTVKQRHTNVSFAPSGQIAFVGAKDLTRALAQRASDGEQCRVLGGGVYTGERARSLARTRANISYG